MLKYLKLFFNKIDEELINPLIIGAIGAVLTILGEFFIQSFTLRYKDAHKGYLAFFILIMLFFVLIILLRKIIIENRIKSKKEPLPATIKIKKTKPQKVKNHFFKKKYIAPLLLVCCVIIEIFLMSRLFSYHQKIQTLSALFNKKKISKYIKINDPLQNHWIVISDIKIGDNVKIKVNLVDILRKQLMNEIQEYSLPIIIKTGSLNEKEIDSLASIVKGLYVVSGSYDEYSISLTVDNYSYKKNLKLALANKFGLQNSFNNLIPIDFEYGEFSTATREDFQQEYNLQVIIPQELKYLTMKMIGDVMLSEMSTIKKDKDSTETRKKIIDYSLIVNKLAEENISYTSFLGFFPKPDPRLNANQLYANIANCYLFRGSLKKINDEEMNSEFEKAKKYTELIEVNIGKNAQKKDFDIFFKKNNLRLMSWLCKTNLNVYNSNFKIAFHSALIQVLLENKDKSTAPFISNVKSISDITQIIKVAEAMTSEKLS